MSTTRLANVDFTIGIIGIAFSISAEQRRAGSGNLEKGLDHLGVSQIAHQQIALGVNVGPDVGDLPGVMAQADTAVERD